MDRRLTALAMVLERRRLLLLTVVGCHIYNMRRLLLRLLGSASTISVIGATLEDLLRVDAVEERLLRLMLLACAGCHLR